MNTQDQVFRLENFDETIQAWDALRGEYKTQADAEKAGRKHSIAFQETVRVLVVELPTRKVSVVSEI